MSKVIITSQKLIDLADAVRTHNSISDKLKLPDIPGMLNVELAPGTYDASGNLLKSWSQLLSDGDVSVRDGVLTSLTEKDMISPVESYFVSGPALTMADVDTIVIDDSVTEIGEGNYGAFEGCSNLKNVIFKGNIEAIGSRAFWGCGISSIDFIKGVNILGDEVFCDCKNIGPDLIIPDWWLAVNYKNDGTGMFSRCTGIKNIVLSNGIQNIPRGFVSYCVNLESINMPASIREIGASALGGCNKLKIVDMPNGVEKIGEGAFHHSGITDITMPTSVKSIGSAAFNGCFGITKFTIPSGVTTVDSRVFADCTGLKEIIMPNSVTNIETNAFQSCTGLTEIIIPESVVSINSYAFFNCSNLTKIYYKGTATGAPWGATNATVITDF